jgi:TonB family protein
VKNSHQGLLISVCIHLGVAYAIIHALRAPESKMLARIDSIEVISDSSSEAAPPAHGKNHAAHPISAPISNPVSVSNPVSASAPVSESSSTNVSSDPERDVNEPARSQAIQSYLSWIREKLSHSLQAPHSQNTISRRLMLRLTIMSTGALQDSQIEESSGSQELDRTVLEAVRKSLPFPPFPPEMGLNHPISLKLPIEILKR